MAKKNLTLLEELREEYSIPTGDKFFGHSNALFSDRAKGMKIDIKPNDQPSIFGSSDFQIPAINARCHKVLVDRPNMGWGRNPKYDYWQLDLPNKSIKFLNYTAMISLIALKIKKLDVN